MPTPPPLIDNLCRRERVDAFRLDAIRLDIGDGVCNRRADRLLRSL